MDMVDYGDFDDDEADDNGVDIQDASIPRRRLMNT